MKSTFFTVILLILLSSEKLVLSNPCCPKVQDLISNNNIVHVFENNLILVPVPSVEEDENYEDQLVDIVSLRPQILFNHQALGNNLICLAMYFISFVPLIDNWLLELIVTVSMIITIRIGLYRHFDVDNDFPLERFIIAPFNWTLEFVILLADYRANPCRLGLIAIFWVQYMYLNRIKN